MMTPNGNPDYREQYYWLRFLYGRTKKEIFWLLLVSIVMNSSGVMIAEGQVLIEPGPASGIAVKEAPGSMLGNRRLLYQNMYISLSPDLVIERFLNGSEIKSEQVKEWVQPHKEEAQRATKE